MEKELRLKYYLKTIWIISLFLISLCELQSAKNDTIKYINPVIELQNDISSLIKNPEFYNSHIGISVFSVKYADYLIQFNANKNFIPASNQKLITSAAALNYLGDDFYYTTKIYLDGELKENGEFNGNIIIRGSGDPTLSRYFYNNPDEVIDNWIKILDSVGIKAIQGNIIGDDRYFDNQYYGKGWAWDDMLYPFSSQVNAISFNDNKLDFTIFQGDSAGETTNVSVYPENTYIRIINNIKTGSTEDITKISIQREFGTNLLELNGVIAFDSTKNNYETISATIDNPTLFLLNIFREKLDKHQIRFRGALLDIDDIDLKIDYTKLESVIEHHSPELSEIIKVINKNSHNLASEILLKTIAKETTGSGDFENGILKIEEYLKQIGINTNSIYIVDGSGLSRMNLISPNNLITLLNKIYLSENRDIFLSSLAMPGEEGTLERRLKNSLAEKSVYAKTGSMNNVSTISGYIKTIDNEYLAFSIMMQNYSLPNSMARNLQDLIIMRLSSFSRGKKNEN